MPDWKKMRPLLQLRASDGVHSSNFDSQNWLVTSERSINVTLESLSNRTENLRECLAEVLGHRHSTHSGKFVIYPDEAFLAVEDANRGGTTISSKEVALSYF